METRSPFAALADELTKPELDWSVIDPMMRDALERAGVTWQDLAPVVSAESLRAWFNWSPIELPAKGLRVVYFASVEGGQYVKIGQSKHLERRLAEFDRLSPHDVTLEAWVPYTDGLESKLHDTFAHLRVKGEWFWRSDELTDLIERIRDGLL